MAADQPNILAQISQLEDGQTLDARLEVDDRVMARITDGIYRQPSSALRELISNAYDADATRVVIQTDAPRFERISVRDNGLGMSPETLAYLITHIGGSSKRTIQGKNLGTVNTSDVTQSPGGRKLIGKIGIGLFAVSHLTQHFQIITKRKGDKFRTSAVVSLLTHSEENLEHDAEAKFEAGSVQISKEPTQESGSQGTEIILMNLRPSTRRLLASEDRWDALDLGENESLTQALGAIEAPEYHIGRVSKDDNTSFEIESQLPWEEDDGPSERFRSLFAEVSQFDNKRVGTPTLENLLDNYLQMIWTLALGVPVKYIDKHPLECRHADELELFQLSNANKGQASELGEDVSLDEMHFIALKPDPVGGFEVFIDGVELLHPVHISGGSERENKQGHRPLLFFGQCRSPLGKVPSDLGGGHLEFEAYFYWNSTIIPKNNNGVLVRVNGASGMGFDESFFDYRISELTRLRQIMAEVYVHRGLDAALNIDRESFNNSHPHYLFLKDWIHRSLRQVTNKLKGLSKNALAKKRETKSNDIAEKIIGYSEQAWSRYHGNDVPVPVVEIVKGAKAAEARREGHIALDVLDLNRADKNGLDCNPLVEARVKALTTILTSHGLTERLTYEQLHALIRDILYVFEENGGK